MAAMREACETHQKKLIISEELSQRTFDRLNEDVARLRSERKREEDTIFELEAGASDIRNEEMQFRTQTSDEIDQLIAIRAASR